MPTYQYACTECGNGTEVVQSFTDDALTVCDACGGRLRKVFGSVGIVFKGSGFYRTDSREAAKAATPAKAKGDADKKPDTKKADTTSSDSTSTPAKSSKPADSGSSGTKTPASSGSSTKGSAA